MKYIKRTKNIQTDFEYYLGNEGLFGHFFGHLTKTNQKQKVNYIWNSLLKSHGHL